MQWISGIFALQHASAGVMADKPLLIRQTKGKGLRSLSLTEKKA